FQDASFDTAVLFRVYNFLSAPGRALRELGRVLTPGGVLIVTVHTRPSVATLVDDTRLFLGKVPGATMRPTTFRSGGPARGVSGLPTWLPTREDVRRLFESSGFRVDSEHPLGLEDFRPFSWWPRRSLQKFSAWTQGLDLAPFRLYRLRGPGSIAEALRPGLGSILSCPKCRAPFPSLDMSKPPDALRCGSCGSSWGVQERMLDLRFDPEAIPPSP
ncbi:MAG TPA: methyltransferase domain-containing protein, partial [Thermoplasmata archaeon]|nr:methyltransferase domain-containing protein [Thermoplasmata archaeon]